MKKVRTCTINTMPLPVRETKNKNVPKSSCFRDLKSKTNYLRRGRPLPPKRGRNFLVRDEIPVSSGRWVLHEPRGQAHRHPAQAEGGVDHRLASLFGLSPSLASVCERKSLCGAFGMSDSEAKTFQYVRECKDGVIINMYIQIVTTFPDRVAAKVKRVVAQSTPTSFFCKQESQRETCARLREHRKPASRHEAEGSSALELAALYMVAVRSASVA